MKVEPLKSFKNNSLSRIQEEILSSEDQSA